jgi:hypothetical protein
VTTAAVAAALILTGCGSTGSEAAVDDLLPREIGPTIGKTIETELETSPSAIVAGAESVFERAVGIELGYVGAIGGRIQTVDFTEWELERRRTPLPDRASVVGTTGVEVPHNTAIYFLESLARAFETGLTEPLRTLAAPECEGCRLLIEQTETNAVGGYYHDDPALEMASWYGLTAHWDGSQEIWIDGMFHETDILGSRGEVIDTAEELRFTAYTYMTFTSGEWQVAAVEIREPSPNWSLE